jgi:hypothetical protein
MKDVFGKTSGSLSGHWFLVSDSQQGVGVMKNVQLTGITVLLALVWTLGGGVCRVLAVPVPHKVGSRAFTLASMVRGTWTRPPGWVPSQTMPGGPLLGNGSLGAVLAGPPDKLQFYVGRDDFWSVLRGRIMPVGRLGISIPALAQSGYLANENIGPADVFGRFSAPDGRNLIIRSWIANPTNLLVLQLANRGSSPLRMSIKLSDGWGTAGATGMSGHTGEIRWLSVSPDTVDARIGEPSGRDPAGKFHGVIANVRVLPKAVNPSLLGAIPAAAGAVRLAPRFMFANSVQRQAHPASKSTRLDCGNLAMPQRAFTVTAWIYPRSNKGQQAIFSAMTSDTWQHWMQPGPNPPLISYGFAFSTIDGKLSALLNRVRITAAQSLPLNRWSRVAAIYNGRSLSLVINGVSVARTSKFPTAAQVIGPQWDWNAIHPGDPHIPFDGCSPEGLLAVRVLGNMARISHGSVLLTLPAGRNATVLLSALDDRDNAHYRAASLQLLNSLTAAGVQHLWQQHLEWWKTFWQRSYVKLPDKKIQDAWYGSLYVLASCSAPGNIAPGLWGNFITTPHMGWNGDYTLDYNYEAPYWAAYPTNHVALADNYDKALLDWMPRGRGLAKHRHYHGLFYYAHLSPMPGWSADGAKSIRQKSDALFATVDCLQRWRYTRSVSYARRVYPFLRGVAQFWDHYLVLKNGVYMDYNDAADELRFPHDVNPATSIAFLRMLYSGLLDMNHTLNRNDPDAAKWRYILAHLSPLPIVPASSIGPIVRAVGRAATQGKFVIRNALIGSRWINVGHLLSPNPPVRVTGSSAGMNSHQTIFPAWAVGLESPRFDRRAALNTIRFQKTWYDANNTSSFYPAAADAGYNPQSILHHLHLLVTRIAFPNFAYNIGNGGVENEATVPTTICAMFLQSYQSHIHLFPNWPKNQNASFGNLLACGDFLVSSAINHGNISYARIVSRRGGVCSIANPWPGHAVELTISGRKPVVLSGPVLRVRTTRGEVFTLTAALR